MDSKNDEATLKAYSIDGSIFTVTPSEVFSPKNKEELIEIVKSGKIITPRGAGTCMSGGPLTEHAVIDMTHAFNAIGEIDVTTHEVWVGVGVYYRDLEKNLTSKGLVFPPYTSSKDYCTIGGMVGNNASGEKSIRYGATVNNVTAVKMVCFDGNEYEFGELNEIQFEAKMQLQTSEGDIYRSLHELIGDNEEILLAAAPRVKKNAAGYGLWRVHDANKGTWNIAKLIVGSQGTLGIVTEAKLKLIPLAPYMRMIVIPIKTLTELGDVIATIMEFSPEGVETYDHHTYELAEQFMKEDAEAAIIAKGMELIVFAQFAESTQETTDTIAAHVVEALKAKGHIAKMVTQERERVAHWNMRRESYMLLKSHAPSGLRAVPCIEDTIVSIEHYGDFLEKLEAILSQFKMTYTFAGHIGDGSIRLIPLIDMEHKDTREMVFELSQKVYELVVTFGGSISVDHNDGIIRTPYLHLMYTPEVLALFVRTKHIFDPMGIFNPGKKVGGTLQYAKDHVISTNRT